jgi:large subunit ribosomal protein L3
MAIDNKKGSFTFGKEISIPITIIEAPPMIGCALRLYKLAPDGLKCLTEIWAEKAAPDIQRLISRPREVDADKSASELISSPDGIAEVRLLMATQPRLSATGKKTPELMEVKIGGDAKLRLDYAKTLLGKEVKASEVFKDGEIVDVVGVTKGKGIQGPVKRWGIKRKPHKSRKTVRAVGSIGPWNPSYVVYSVPRAGQTGFHQRTEYNKQIVRIGEDGVEITPRGGFTKYGRVKGNYVMIAGSVPGPPKRAIAMRHAARATSTGEEPPKIEHISLRLKAQAA